MLGFFFINLMVCVPTHEGILIQTLYLNVHTGIFIHLCVICILPNHKVPNNFIVVA